MKKIIGILFCVFSFVACSVEEKEHPCICENLLQNVKKYDPFNQKYIYKYDQNSKVCGYGNLNLSGDVLDVANHYEWYAAGKINASKPGYSIFGVTCSEHKRIFIATERQNMKKDEADLDILNTELHELGHAYSFEKYAKVGHGNAWTQSTFICARNHWENEMAETSSEKDESYYSLLAYNIRGSLQYGEVDRSQIFLHFNSNTISIEKEKHKEWLSLSTSGWDMN